MMEVGSLPDIGTGMRVRLGRCLNHLSGACAAKVRWVVVEIAAIGVNVTTVGGDFGALDPVTIGVVVKIAGLFRAIHSADNDAVGL